MFLFFWLGNPNAVLYSELSYKNRILLCNKSQHCAYIVYRVKTWFKKKFTLGSSIIANNILRVTEFYERLSSVHA